MTADLKSSKIKIEHATNDLQGTNLELERRRQYTETILKNVAAGVVSIDEKGLVTSINKSAENLLRTNAAESLSRPYEEAFAQEQMNVSYQLPHAVHLTL